MAAIEKEVTAALTRIKQKNPGLPKQLERAAGYVVFPSVGRASLVVGGAYGKGLAYERGQLIGEASLGQVTLGVQVGGQTFSEVVIFNSRDALERFKRGRIAFDSNASAAIVKAAGSGTSDYEKDVEVHAYTQGGLLLELSLGVQAFNFKPQATLEHPGASHEQEPPREEPRGEPRSET